MNHIISSHHLQKIPLFSGLNDVILEELTHFAHHAHYQKDEHIFFAQDTLDMFYLIDTGLVRTYALDEKGNESTLQILSRHHYIHDIIGNNASMSAQAIQDCSIIKFNANTIRNYFENNPILAMNFANEMMQRNKELLAQLSRSRLLSAKEKLGRFLLNLSLTDNGVKSLEIDLHISKSMIASYLGMNLETFSRALKKLKDDHDITIMGNKITFLKEESLCNYCDEEIGSNCNNRGEIYCKLND